MHVDGWLVVSVTLTVAVVAVIAVTEKLTPPAGSLYVEPAVMPLTGFVDGFMSMSTLRAQVWFGWRTSSEACTITAGVIPVSSPVLVRNSR